MSLMAMLRAYFPYYILVPAAPEQEQQGVLYQRLTGRWSHSLSGGEEL